MGGTIPLTIRESDGTIHKMVMHTNLIKRTILTKEFLSEDRDTLNNLIKPWQKLKEDWIQNKDSGVFNDRTAPWYAPNGQLAPHDYGLIVIDFMNKEILSSQNYTSLKGIAANNPITECIRLLSMMDKRVVDDEICAQIALEKNSYIKHLFDLFEAGAITGVNYCKHRVEDGRLVFDKMLTKSTADMRFSDLMHFCFEHENSRFYKNIGNDIQDESAYDFDVKFDDFELHTFAALDHDASVKMKSHIEKRGFVLDDIETSAWDEWFSQLEKENNRCQLPPLKGQACKSLC